MHEVVGNVAHLYTQELTNKMQSRGSYHSCPRLYNTYVHVLRWAEHVKKGHLNSQTNDALGASYIKATSQTDEV